LDRLDTPRLTRAIPTGSTGIDLHHAAWSAKAAKAPR
jgi:hypothetical protein